MCVLQGKTAAKPKLAKQQTMAATAAEGQQVVGKKPREKTRGKTKAAAKKARLSKHTTIKATTAASKAIVGGKKLGAIRKQTQAKPKVKRQVCTEYARVYAAYVGPTGEWQNKSHWSISVTVSWSNSYS